MAKPTLPDPLSRRHLLERELAPESALRIAEAYLAAGRRVEALAFLVKAAAHDRLRELQEAAVAEGDAFLLKETARALAEKPGVARWRLLAQAAQAAGKLRYAAEAQRQAERGEG